MPYIAPPIDDMPLVPPDEQIHPQDEQAEAQSEIKIEAILGTMATGASYFQQGDFAKEQAAFASCANRVTGYANLDAIQPLYPGLYTLGAISSLGKTTFIHQMADQIAAAGQSVLYFSLEQSRLELFSKSLARGFCRVNREDTRRNNRPSTYPIPSSMDIRRGLAGSTYPNELQQQIDDYSNMVSDRIGIIDGNFGITVEDIIGTIDLYIKTYKSKPVVVIDYLQIVAPSMINGRLMDNRTSIDHIVHSLKVEQVAHNLTMIVISSLNRANYLTPVDFESFKESGGIEYTSDVLWGLQLSVLRTQEYEKEKTITKQREMIAEAKAQSPRAIDLICMKNRYGRSSYNVSFDYFPASDLFVPVMPHISFGANIQTPRD